MFQLAFTRPAGDKWHYNLLWDFSPKALRKLYVNLLSPCEIGHVWVPFLLMGVLGLSAMSYQGSPETCIKRGVCPRGRVLRSAGGSQNFLGSGLHSESPPAAASSPPSWQWGCSTISASLWLCPERSRPQPGYRETHSSRSAGRTPHVATGGDGLVPKTGDGEPPGWAERDSPRSFLSGVGRWCWPSPSLGARAATTRARGSCGRHSVANTHGLGYVLWTERIRLPPPALGAKSHFLWCSFSISTPGHVSDGCRDREVWSEPFALCVSGWGLLFLSLLLGPILVLSSFLLFIFFSPLEGLSKVVPTNPHPWAPPDCPSLCFPRAHHCLCCHAGKWHCSIIQNSDFRK